MGLAVTISLNAQQWEYVYGPDEDQQTGKLRVQPVTGACSSPSCCSGTDGYIAVGWDQGDVYVVRTDNSGARIWEKSYDITGNGSDDDASAIVELADGSGFAITGTTIWNTGSGTTADIFILKIDCNGNQVWSHTYGSPVAQYDEQGWDIIETQTGSSVGVNGEFVVCGTTNATSNNMYEGVLLRTTSSGWLLWMKYYPLTTNVGDNVVFHALTEYHQGSGSPYGDILTVGTYFPQGGVSKGTAVRVSGGAGTFVGWPQGVGYLLPGPSGQPVDLYSVTQLQNPNEKTSPFNWQNAVICGSKGQFNFVAKLLSGDPCNPNPMVTIGDNSQGAYQTAYTIREITFPTTGYTGTASQWDLVFSGVYTPSGGTRNGTLVSLAPATLAPAGIARRFGGAAGEELWSVHPVDTTGGRTFGFILCGWTGTDFMSVGDPGDVYLVKTDGNGNSGCDRPYPDDDNVTTGQSCVTTTPVQYGQRTVHSPGTSNLMTDDQVCPRPGPKTVPGTATPGLSILHPNPAIKGQRISLPVSGNPTGRSGPLAIRVVRISGEEVAMPAQSIILSTNRISIQTDALSAGMYFLEVSGHDGTRTHAFVVAE